MTTMIAPEVVTAPDYQPDSVEPTNLSIESGGPHSVSLRYYSVQWPAAGIHPASDARAAIDELLTAADTAAVDTESHLRAADAESRHAAALEDELRLGVEIGDAQGAVDAALRAGEPADKFEARRNKFESELAGLRRRIPVLQSEADRLRADADAERSRLRRESMQVVQGQHRAALTEIEAELQTAMAPILARREFWLSVGAESFNRR